MPGTACPVAPLQWEFLLRFLVFKFEFRFSKQRQTAPQKGVAGFGLASASEPELELAERCRKCRRWCARGEAVFNEQG